MQEEDLDRRLLSERLAAAREPSETLSIWLEACAPNAGLAGLIEGRQGVFAPTFRHDAGAWHAVALPPLEVNVETVRCESRSTRQGRRHALDDLLASLGYGELLYVALAPSSAGVLILARHEDPFGEAEIAVIEERVLLLGWALALQAERFSAIRDSVGQGPEVAALFDLTRQLSVAIGPRSAMVAAGHCLCDLLQPTAGALTLDLGDGAAPASMAWPEGETGRQALERLAALTPVAPEDPSWLQVESDRNDRGAMHWISFPPSDRGAGVCLGWRIAMPEQVDRVAQVVQSVLSLAGERFGAQQQSQRDLMQSVVEELPLGVCLFEADGRLRLLNPVARRLLEELDEVEQGKSTRLQSLAARCRREPPLREEVVLPESGRTFLVRVHPVRGPKGLADYLAVIEDVSDARMREQQMAQAEKLSSLGMLLGGIVHEINNPLSTILGYAQLLSRSPEAAGRERWIATLEIEARRCQGIVENMLAFARSSENTKGPVDLAHVVDRAVAILAYTCRSKGIELKSSVARGAVVLGQEDALLQVMINLLTNATHALEEQPVPRIISIRVDASGPRIETEVSDTGPGIADAHLDRLFDPFFTTKAKGRGTGLGLSLVAATIEDHGGEIRVTSHPGKGTLFRISLDPLEARPVERKSNAPAAAERKRRLADVNVLVIEDEAPLASVLQEALSLVGCRIRLAGDGGEGLEMLESWTPDAIICDLRMPRTSGEAFWQHLKSDHPGLCARTIFSTGDMLAAKSSEAVRESGRDPLLKPFDLERVYAEVERLVRIDAPPQPRPGDIPPPRRPSV